jgi:hypothetical protein
MRLLIRNDAPQPPEAQTSGPTAGSRPMLRKPTHCFAALMAREFLVIAGNGDVYRVEEGRSRLEQTGWRFVEYRSLEGPSSLVMAEA